MNKIYKVIWSKAKNCYVVVSEIAKRNGKCKSTVQKAVIASLLAGAVVMPQGTALGAAIAFGSNAVASGGNSVAVGDSAAATAEKTTAVGFYANANKQEATALGAGAKAFGIQAVAIGRNARADGDRAVAIGQYAVSSGPGSFATQGGTAVAYNSTAFGTGTRAGSKDLTDTTIVEITSYQSRTVTGFAKVSYGGKEYYRLTFPDGHTEDKTLEQIEASANYAIAPKGSNSVAFGNSTLASNANATAFGFNTEASGENATAFGQGTKATSDYATAFGFNTEATARAATAFGWETRASEARSTAFGVETEASGRNSTAFGYRTTASGENATAFGSSTKANGAGSTSWGTETESNAEASTSWGIKSKVYGGTFKGGTEVDGVTYGTAGRSYYNVEVLRSYGQDESIYGTTGTHYIEGTYTEDGVEKKEVIKNNVGSATDTVAGRAEADAWLKKYGSLGGRNATAFGDESSAYSVNSLAALGGTVGALGENYGVNSAAIGKGAEVKSDNAYAMGNKATIGTDSTGSVALGGLEGTQTTIGTNATNSFAAVGGKIGNGSTNAIAIGGAVDASAPSAIAIGKNSKAEKVNATALGQDATASAKNATAIGSGASASMKGSVALGSDSVANRAAGTPGYDIATGASSKLNAPAWKATTAAVSIGDGSSVTRQITGVAAGYEDTDAVNVAQLKRVADMGLNFDANTGGKKTNKLGSTVRVIGEGTKGQSEYSGKNVQTVITQDVSGDTTIAVKIDENPEFESVTAGTNASTKVFISDKGVQVGGNTYISSTGINANSKTITNVAAGTNDTDAVNVSQLKKSRTQITAGKNVSVAQSVDSESGAYTYTVDANDTIVVAGPGATVNGGELDKDSRVRTYTVAVNKNDKLTVSGGAVSGGTSNQYWDSKQTEDAINNAYWTASDGTNDIHVSAGRTVRFEGKSGITVANVDGVFTFDAQPLTFGGDTGTNVTRKLGEKVNVVGGVTSGDSLTDNNIGVVADGTDKLTVKLAKDVNLTDQGSLAIGNSVINNAGVTAATVTAGTGASQTVIGSSGVQVGGNTYVNNAGINANEKKITNVAPGTDGNDAVNVNQLNDVKWNIGTGSSGGTNNGSGALALTPVGKQDGVDRSNIRFNAGAGVNISHSTILTGTSKDDKEIGYNIDISTKFQDATISSNGSGHYIQAITYDGREYLLAGGGSGTAAPTDVISDNRVVTAELLKTYNETTQNYDFAIEVLSPFINVNGLKDENGKPAKIHADDFAQAKGESAIAIGKRAEAEADNSLALGHNADAKAENSTAMGLNSHAHGANSVALGVAATSSGNRAIAIGTTASYDSSRETPENSTLPHQGSCAVGQASIVLGDHARALSENYRLDDDLIGTPDYATNDAIAIGTKAEVRATNAIALGGNLSYTDENGVTSYGELNGRKVGAVVGDYAKSGIAIGGAYGTVENGVITTEIDAAATYGVRGIAIGTGAMVANKDDFKELENLLSNADYQKAKGDFQKARAEYLDKYSAYEAIKDLPLNDPTLPVGMQITQEEKDQAEYQMNQAKAAMEKATQVYSLELKKSIRLQEKDAIEESDAVAIGTKAIAQVKDSVALGSNSVTTATDRAGSRTGLSGYDPLQQDTDNDYFRGDDKYKEDDPVWRSTAGSLSVGGGTTTVKDENGNDKEVTVTRRISNVAAGINDSDAVNVAQLKRATSLKTDSRNTSIGLDKNGNMVVNSPYLNIQGVKTSSDYTTIVNRFDNAEEYKQSLEDQKTEINSRKESIGVSQGKIKESLEKLEDNYKAKKVSEAVYLVQKEDYNEQWDATERRLADLDASLKEKDTEIANAEKHYQEAIEYYNSQANASGTDSIAMGNKSAAGGKASISIGSDNTVGTPGKLDAGPDAELEKVGEQSIAIGSGNTVTGTQSIAVGTGHKIYGSRSGAFGDPTEIDDSVDGSYAIGNNSHISTSDTFVLGNEVTTTYENSVFLGSKSKYVADGETTAGMSDYSQATINGQTCDFAGGKPAGVVSVGDVGQERRIQNVAAGLITAESTDAINGSQLFAAIQALTIDVKGDGTTTKVDKTTSTGGGGTAATTYTVTASTTEVELGENAKENGNLTLIKENPTTDPKSYKYTIDIAKDITFDSVTSGDTKMDTDGLTINGGPSITKTGIDANGTKITNVADGDVSATSTDAVNGSQLYGAMENVNNSVNNLGNQISNVDSRAKKGIAGAAALAALHPLDFDPDDKLTFAAGMGHYRGETAAALGMFYRPDEKVMLSIGGTMGNGENMVNAGISFSLDRTPRVTGSRTAMAREIVELREQVAQLTALVQKIAGNQGQNMPVVPAMFPDIPVNRFAYDYIEDLQKRGILEGYAGRTLTRAEFAAALDRAVAAGVKLDERVAKEFQPELSRIRVVQVNGYVDGDPQVFERPRSKVHNYK